MPPEPAAYQMPPYGATNLECRVGFDTRPDVARAGLESRLVEQILLKNDVTEERETKRASQPDDDVR